MACVLDHIDIVKDVFKLMLRNGIPWYHSLTPLLLIPDLYLGLENFGLELSFVRSLDADALVVETLPKNSIRLLSPDFLPLTL